MQLFLQYFDIRTNMDVIQLATVVICAQKEQGKD